MSDHFGGRKTVLSLFISAHNIIYFAAIAVQCEHFH